MKAPLARGFNSGRILGGVGGALSLKKHQRREVVPKNETARVRGVPAIPRRSPRPPPLPRSPPVCGEDSFRKMAKRGNTPEESDRPITICAGHHQCRKPQRLWPE